MAVLQEVEDWLYEDGEDETKGVYIAKLEELKKVGVSSISFFASLFGIHRADLVWICSKVTRLSNATKSTRRGVL